MRDTNDSLSKVREEEANMDYYEKGKNMVSEALNAVASNTYNTIIKEDKKTMTVNWQDFFDIIKHGDLEHTKWLAQMISSFATAHEGRLVKIDYTGLGTV